MSNNQQPEYDPGTQLKLQTREAVHKLNNMLFVINGYSQFIRETHLDEETLANVKHIEIASKQIQQILVDWRAKADELIPDPPGT